MIDVIFVHLLVCELKGFLEYMYYFIYIYLYTNLYIHTQNIYQIDLKIFFLSLSLFFLSSRFFYIREIPEDEGFASEFHGFRTYFGLSPMKMVRDLDHIAENRMNWRA